MARSLNRCTFIGNLGKDVECRYFPNGDAVANVSLAVNESWTDKQSGEKKERTEWINLVFMRKLAEIAGQYLHKGSKIYVEGNMRTRKYEKDGIDRYSTEIIVSQMLMLDGRNDGEHPARSGTSAQRPQAQAAQDDAPFEDQDIPF